MNEKISFCGINCADCEAYIATLNNDDELRRKTAENWSKTYNADIKAENINCLGCTSRTEPTFSHCKVCEFRICGMSKNIANCAYCDEYACEKLAKFHEVVPGIKENLDKIRENL
jgi:hypothetical protein